MPKPLPILLVLLGLLLTVPAGPASAQFGPGGGLGDLGGPVFLDLQASKARVKPGDHLVLAVKVTMSDEVDANGKHWHIYPPEPMHDGVEVASTLVPTIPDAFVVGQVQWPKPVLIKNAFGKDQPVYEGEVTVYLPLIVKDDAAVGEYELSIKFGYQPCNSQCLAPTTENLSAKVQVVAASTDLAPDTPTRGDPDTFAGFDASVFDDLEKGEGVYTAESSSSSAELDLYLFKVELDNLGAIAIWALLIGISLVGGLLLNFTPCVLPVIPLKIMGLSQSAGSRGKMLLLGSVMFLGVLAFWAVFGVFFALLKQVDSISVLFQKWWFTIGVGVIVAAMAVGMCGLFSVKLPQWVYRINPRHDSLHGSFGFGVMTAVLATPCTAPFMGTALAGSTQLKNDALVFAVFLAIGAGMGLPYLVLAAFPKLVEKMPRTGPGSELLKQVMGLLMLAAAAFFLGTGLNAILSDGTAPPSKLFWWVVGAFVAAAGVWLAWQVVKISPSPGKRAVFGVIGVALVLSGGYGSYAMTRKPPIQWVYYTPEALETALEKDKVVVLDFTADWCGNCIALEKTVLNKKAVADVLNGDGVVAMKVDITSESNTAGIALRNSYGYSQIPLLVVLNADGEPVFKRDWYGQSEVIDAVKQAGGETVAGR
ncbi:MAG: thioredoxin family protein [Phycisphaeraceae bacterium]